MTDQRVGFPMIDQPSPTSALRVPAAILTRKLGTSRQRLW
jgi:hypothetical protein